MRATLMLLIVVAGCSSDPCAGLSTCLGITVNPPPQSPNLAIDQLTITISGNVNGRRQVPPTPQPATLPQTVALEFNPPGNFMGSFEFQLLIVADKAGQAVAGMRTTIEIMTAQHAADFLGEAMTLMGRSTGAGK